MENEKIKYLGKTLAFGMGSIILGSVVAVIERLSGCESLNAIENPLTPIGYGIYVSTFLSKKSKKLGGLQKILDGTAAMTGFLIGYYPVKSVINP